MRGAEDMVRGFLDAVVGWLSASWVNALILMAAVLLAPTVATLLWKALFGFHAQMRREARSVWKRIQEMPSDSDVYILLRTMHPFAFEELVVLSFRRNGYIAWHGPRYTGDGGVDGWVRFGGEKHPIQDKRYSGTMNPRHVRDFSRLCQGMGATGLFVHTGTTGEASRNAAQFVRIISGRDLIGLVRKDRPFLL